jgi:hypothetical protein
LEIAEAGKYVEDESWRDNLQPGDLIDAYDNSKKWY